MVDDDDDDRMFFEEALEDLGIDCLLETAENGQQAIRMLKDEGNGLPDIVFLDLNMPLLSGRECLERIRGIKDFRDLKVVIYSTSSDRDTVELLRGIGADRYICKPAGYDDLKKVLRTAIGIIWGHGGETFEKPDFVISP